MIKEVTTGKGPVLFVAVPDATKSVELIDSFGRQWLERRGEHIANLKKGSYELLGIYPGLTEDQAARVVEAVYHPRFENPDEGDVLIGYVNYSAEEPLMHTALESFATLMQRERLYTVNPYGKEAPKSYLPKYRVGGFENDRDREADKEFKEQLQKWQEAEARKSACWAVLIKTNK